MEGRPRARPPQWPRAGEKQAKGKEDEVKGKLRLCIGCPGPGGLAPAREIPNAAKKRPDVSLFQVYGRLFYIYIIICP